MLRRQGCRRSAAPPGQLAELPTFSSTKPPGCERCPSASPKLFLVQDRSFLLNEPRKAASPAQHPRPHPDSHRDAERRIAKAARCMLHKAHPRLPACPIAVRPRRQKTPGERSKVFSSFRIQKPSRDSVVSLQDHLRCEKECVAEFWQLACKKRKQAARHIQAATVENRSALS